MWITSYGEHQQPLQNAKQPSFRGIEIEKFTLKFKPHFFNWCMQWGNHSLGEAPLSDAKNACQYEIEKWSKGLGFRATKKTDNFKRLHPRNRSRGRRKKSYQDSNYCLWLNLFLLIWHRALLSIFASHFIATWAAIIREPDSFVTLATVVLEPRTNLHLL